METSLQPEMDKTAEFRDNALEVLRRQLKDSPYPKYPELKDRLYSEADDWFEPVTLPLGPWELSDGIVPSIPEQKAFAQEGLKADSYGRPLHPWFDAMLLDPEVGVLTGKGAYYNWGPNYTADPIIIRRDLDEPHVLLITRRDTGLWALPGGFIDGDEAGLRAAIREANEEALVDLTALSNVSRLVYRGLVADVRMTANAWPVTEAYAFEIPNEIAQALPTEPYQAADDADIASWRPVSELGDNLFGSHRLLIERALASS